MLPNHSSHRGDEGAQPSLRHRPGLTFSPHSSPILLILPLEAWDRVWENEVHIGTQQNKQTNTLDDQEKPEEMESRVWDLAAGSRAASGRPATLPCLYLVCVFTAPCSSLLIFYHLAKSINSVRQGGRFCPRAR